MNDEYFSWDVTYFLTGWLFNRIPLLKEAKMEGGCLMSQVIWAFK